MEEAEGFLVGVIEGFYGRSWSYDTRLAYADHLASAGLNTCLYCPKGDAYLRKSWQQDWPADQWRQLLSLSLAYRRKGIFWGVGLSPFALYQHYGTAEREQLQRKVGRLAELDAPLLAILFDDMPGDMPGLAPRQAEIVGDIAGWLPGVRILVCPTYYSFDPVLEKHFGRMPTNYWAELGAALPVSADIFWTGNKVCSESVSAQDIQRIRAELGRPVLLWDNYPVNDGAVRSNFLYCSKLSHRESLAPGMLSGHLCNPMNQALLSLPALAGLGELYNSMDGDQGWLEEVMGRGTWQQLQADRQDFEQLGLSGLGPNRCRQLERVYRSLPGPAAVEVADWLAGEYIFDPACLTD